MLSSAFIKKPHQLDPNGDNFDYLKPQYKFFSNKTNIAQKQTPKVHNFKTDMDKVKFNYAYKKAMIQDNYPDKINYKFNKTNKDEFVGGAKEDENLHARKMRLLRIQAENFEKGEANTLKNLSDTVPFTEDRATFIQILQNLAEIRSNVGTGESLKEVKPERLNGILGQTMNSGINFNKKQLNQLRQVIEEILNNSIKNRIIQNKPKFLTMLKIYAIVVHLLATVNTQDNEIRKRKLEAFVDNVLDQPAQIIAQVLTSSFPSIVHIPKAELFEKADAVDSVPKNVSFSPPARNVNPIHQRTPRQGSRETNFENNASSTPRPTTKKALLKQGDKKTWIETKNSSINTLLNRSDLQTVAEQLGLNFDTDATKNNLIKMIKETLTQDVPITPQASANASATPQTQFFTPTGETPGVSTRSQRARQIDFQNDDTDEMPPLETPEEEAKRTGSGRKKRKGAGKQQVKVTAGFYPNRRSLLRFLK